jgi:uncharacterized protein YfaT (DUF1175 family)
MLIFLASACTFAGPSPSARDLDGDGYPDSAELVSEDDRRAFVTAFVTVALAQAPTPEPTFDPAQRDCAGLVRYAYREALKRHDAAFASRHPGLPRLPDVRAFHYPGVPLLGTRLFRIRPGPFATASVQADFAEAPEAARLAEGSARRVPCPPLRGDLLFFRSAKASHLMIVATSGADPMLVYHTGPYDSGPGEVRRVSLSALNAHPDPAWRPREGNEAFAGCYRFKILEGA